ncbi:MAG: hypothetical protein K2I74_06635 [Treponemataceae bacterium]|nr:hypothetical protein [Treponemataceae bacterium]
MKKLLLTLACAASLGLWMSCSDSNELDVTTHSADETAYGYGGSLTATYHYYDEHYVGDEKPTDTKHEYYDREIYNGRDYETGEPIYTKEWYWGEWKEENLSDDIATISWTVKDFVETNVRIYTIASDTFDNLRTSAIRKQGNSYYFSYSTYGNYDNESGTEKITVTGSLEGDTFTIAEFHKPTYEEGERPSDNDWYYTNIVFTKAK